MERQRTDANNQPGRERGAVSGRDDAALVARYERLLAALERSAASRERTSLATRLGRGHQYRTIHRHAS
jgi:hypothetical protein